jgi:hypothetical protein
MLIDNNEHTGITIYIHLLCLLQKINSAELLCIQPNSSTFSFGKSPSQITVATNVIPSTGTVIKNEPDNIKEYEKAVESFQGVPNNASDTDSDDETQSAQAERQSAKLKTIIPLCLLQKINSAELLCIQPNSSTFSFGGKFFLKCSTCSCCCRSCSFSFRMRSPAGLSDIDVYIL